MPLVLRTVACEIAATFLCFQVSWNNLKPSFSFFCKPLMLLFRFCSAPDCTEACPGAPCAGYSWLTVWQDSSLRMPLEDPSNRDRLTVLQHHPDAAFRSCSTFTAHPVHVMSLNPSVLQEKSLLQSDCINCLWQPYIFFVTALEFFSGRSLCELGLMDRWPSLEQSFLRGRIRKVPVCRYLHRQKVTCTRYLHVGDVLYLEHV